MDIKKIDEAIDAVSERIKEEATNGGDFQGISQMMTALAEMIKAREVIL